LNETEFELADTGIFDGDRYFDVFVEYAKADPDDILIRITAFNRGPETAPLHLLPTFWFRNTWVWGCEHEGCTRKPALRLEGTQSGGLRHNVAQTSSLQPQSKGLRHGILRAQHETLGEFLIAADPATGSSPIEWLFTENESNSIRLWGTESYTPYVKDAFHAYVVDGRKDAVNPRSVGTKVAAHARVEVPPEGRVEIRLRLRPASAGAERFFGSGFQEVFEQRIGEADRFAL